MTADFIAQATIPVSDLEAAKAWYEKMLDVTEGEQLSEGVFYKTGGGTQFQIYQTPTNAGKSPATVMGLITGDIVSAVATLKARGVVFEDYDMPNFKTVESVATTASGAKAAWFKDPDGNILGLLQMPPT